MATIDSIVNWYRPMLKEESDVLESSAIIPVSKEEEEEYASRLFVLLSHPRSGSHFTRRMLAEIPAHRAGEDCRFGSGLNRFAGFHPQSVNDDLWKAQDGAIYIATHGMDAYAERHIRVLLKRPFPEVFKSCRKAEQQLHGCWFGGTELDVYRRWKATNKFGRRVAEAVIDYRDIVRDPKSVLQFIFNMSEYEVTDEELDMAVEAGSRENMLAEQELVTARQWDVVNPGS